MDDFLDLLKLIFVCMLAFCVIFCVVAFGVMQPIDSYGCTRTGAKMGLEVQYSIWTDCMVKTPGGKWVSMKRYQAIAIDQEK